MDKEQKQQCNNESINDLHAMLDNVLVDKQTRNEKEIKTINNELLKRSEKILDEFGPEGAYKMSEFLRMIADKDIEQGMQL